MDDASGRTPPESAGDKAPGGGAAEPLSAEVSRAGVPADATEGTQPPVGAAKPPPPAPARAEHVKVIPPPPGPPDPPPPSDLTAPAFLATLNAVLPGAIVQTSWWVGDWTIIVPAARLLEVATHLRDAPEGRFDFCSDVTATDWPARAQRFDVIYVLYSIPLRHRIRLKVRLLDGETVPSVSGVWPAANWLEREVFDLFGIRFDGHPDLRRILMPDDWQGHPQRKDYPLEGPGEMLLENPGDWLKLKQAREIE